MPSLSRPHALASLAPRPVLQSRLLTFATASPIELIDITEPVAALVRECRLAHGQLSLLSRHTTAAIRIQENEPLLLDDFRDLLSDLAPAHRAYRHNDFRVRTHHMHPDERPNGHAHCLQLLLGSSESVPVINGELALGTWQRLFLVELDGPRPNREVLVQLSGQTAPRAAQARWSPVLVSATA
jgi:secondary thiamine-phosphate synthase enzyme